MFEKPGVDHKIVPDNFEELLIRPDSKPDASIISVDSSDSIPLQHVEGENVIIERPFNREDTVANEIIAAPILEDANWRNRVENILMEKINYVSHFNKEYKGQVEPIKVNFVWHRMLCRIREINRQVKQYGLVTDVGLYKWNIKPESDSEDSDSDDATNGVVYKPDRKRELNDSNIVTSDTDSMPQLEGSESSDVETLAEQLAATNVNANEPSDTVSNVPLLDSTIETELEFEYVGTGGNDYEIADDILNLPADELGSLRILHNSLNFLGKLNLRF